MDYDTLKGIGAWAGLLIGGPVFLVTGFYLSRKLERIVSENPIPLKEEPKVNDTWYLWLNLTTPEDKDALIPNHLELRNSFNNLGKKYSHLQIHDGNFDTLPKCVIVLTSRSILSSRYCLAKTSEQYQPEIASLRNDLVNASLEARIIGPTNNPQDVFQYGDNFKLQKIVERKYT